MPCSVRPLSISQRTSFLSFFSSVLFSSSEQPCEKTKFLRQSDDHDDLNFPIQSTQKTSIQECQVKRSHSLILDRFGMMMAMVMIILGSIAHSCERSSSNKETFFCVVNVFLCVSFIFPLLHG